MGKFNAALAALIFSGAAFAHAQWSVVSTQSEFSTGKLVEHRHVVARSASSEEATLDLALFSSKNATLRVIDDPAETHARLTETMQREGCLAGVNGGYFDPDYAPVGLLISDGRLMAPLRKARLLSGVVSMANGQVQIQRPAEFSMKTKPFAARQCGPFLVNGGKAIAGLNDTREARRTFVATLGDDRAAIGYCSYVTLAQLAAALASSGLNIQRALNLDGGSSSAFWFAGEKGAFSIHEQKTVRDYLAIVPR